MAQEATYDWVAARFRDLSAGTLSPVDRERLRAIAVSDPFVADALEGYEAVPAADHASHLEQLATRISQARRPRRRWLIPNLTVTAIAATFMILIGTWAVIRWMTPAEESRLVILSTPEEAREMPAGTAREADPTADPVTTPPAAELVIRQAGEPEAADPKPAAPAISTRAKRPVPAETQSSPALLQSPVREGAQNALRAPAPIKPVRLTGRVTDLQGKPVREASLLVLPSNLRFAVDSTGAFETWLPPANLMITVTAPGFRQHEQSLSGSDSAIAIVLHPETPEQAKVRLDQPGAYRFPLDVWPTPSYDGFLEWLETNARLPLTRQYQADSKYVTVSFAVALNNPPGKVQVISTNAPPAYSDEAVRLFSASPPWICLEGGPRCTAVFTLCFK